MSALVIQKISCGQAHSLPHRLPDRCDPALPRAGGDLGVDCLELSLEYGDATAKLVVIKLHQGAGRQVGKLRQHGALVMIEIGAGSMRSIESKRQAAQAIPHRNREDRPPRPLG